MRINVWKDSWIPDLPSGKAVKQGVMVDENLLVPDLIHNGKWNLSSMVHCMTSKTMSNYEPHPI